MTEPTYHIMQRQGEALRYDDFESWVTACCFLAPGHDDLVRVGCELKRDVMIEHGSTTCVVHEVEPRVWTRPVPTTP